MFTKLGFIQELIHSTFQLMGYSTLAVLLITMDFSMVGSNVYIVGCCFQACHGASEKCQTC